MADERYYATDTHSLIWYLYDIPWLSPAAQTAFTEIEGGEAVLLIPAIVLAEIVFVVERRRHDIDINEALERIAEADNFRLLPFSLNTARQLVSTTAIPEMHDRMIVCEALLNGARLITKDESIRKAGVVEVVW